MKKKLLSALLVISMTFSLAACGSSNEKKDDTNTGTTKEDTAKEDETKEDETKEDETKGDASADEDVLNVCIASEPETIDPSQNTSMDGATYIQHVFEGLMKFEAVEGEPGTEPKIVPGQAAEMPEISEDEKTYTFKLRDDIFWSDGEPVKADDFVYAWRRLVNPATTSDYSYIIAMIENATEITESKKEITELGVKAVDEKTLEVKLVSPTAYFLELCAFSSLMPLREDVVEGNDTWATTPETYIGNGKYKVTEWVHDDYITMEKSDKYYNPDEVKMNSIKWALKDDDNAILADFRSGTLDLINQVPADELDTLTGEGTLKTVPQLGTYAVVFNVEKEPFKDPKVRKALSLAIDRNYIAEQIVKTDVVPANAWIPTGIPNGEKGDFNETKGGYYSVENTEEAYKKNCDEARKLLEEAGYPNGEGFPPVNYLYNTMDKHQKIYESLAYMWKEELGIDVTGSNQDWNVFLESRTKGDFELARHAWIADVTDPINFLDMWTTGNGNNYAQWSSEEYDKLINDAIAELDPEKRMELLHKAEDLIIDEEAIVAPIFFSTELYCLNPEVKGASHTQLGYWHFWNVEK